jgi:hypothetical protein
MKMKNSDMCLPMNGGQWSMSRTSQSLSDYFTSPAAFPLAAFPVFFLFNLPAFSSSSFACSQGLLR